MMAVLQEDVQFDIEHEYAANVRLLSRNPRQVNDTDDLAPANLLDAGQTLGAGAASSRRRNLLQSGQDRVHNG